MGGDCMPIILTNVFSWVKEYAIVLAVIAGIGGFIGYTTWQRHDAAAVQVKKDNAATTKITMPLQRKKNAITNRPRSHAGTSKRLRALNW